MVLWGCRGGSTGQGLCSEPPDQPESILLVTVLPPLTVEYGPFAVLVAPPVTELNDPPAMLLAPPLTEEEPPLAVLFSPPLTEE